MGVLEGRGRHILPRLALVPGAPGVDFAVIAFARRIIKKLIDELWRRRDLSDAEWRFAHALEGKRERTHVRDFACHEKLKGILGAGIPAEVDQPLVNDLG